MFDSFCGTFLAYLESRARKGAVQAVWEILRLQILQLYTQCFLRPFLNN